MFTLFFLKPSFLCPYCTSNTRLLLSLFYLLKTKSLMCDCTVLIFIKFGRWKSRFDNIPGIRQDESFRLSSRKLTVLVWSLVCEQCLMSCVTYKIKLNYEWNDRKIKKKKHMANVENLQLWVLFCFFVKQ